MTNPSSTLLSESDPTVQMAAEPYKIIPRLDAWLRTRNLSMCMMRVMQRAVPQSKAPTRPADPNQLTLA